MMADLLREVLRMGDESGVTYVRSKHVPEETLAQLAYLTHDHAVAAGRQESSAGDRIYDGGIQPWWRDEGNLSEEEAARLFHLRSDVVAWLEEQGLASRPDPRSTLLHVWPRSDAAQDKGPLVWTRDEVILALDLFVQAGSLNGGPLPGKTDRRVTELSGLLQKLPVYPRSRRGPKFRNPAGVALKLANFRAVERGVKLALGILEANSLPRGMSSSNAMDREVFEDFFERDFRGLSEAAQAIRATADQYDDAVPAVVVESCPVESDATAYYETSGTSGGMAVRAEHGLVARYTAWLAGIGIEAVARLYRVPGLALPLRCDVFLPEKNVLIEAKSSCRRESIRMAIGQLLDYRRYEKTEPELAILLPSEPSTDIRDFLASLDVAWIWLSKSGFHDSVKGRYIGVLDVAGPCVNPQREP
jgi:hypothetical protein